LFLGREEEYHRTRGELLTRFGTTRDPTTAERYGRGCLLRPASGDDLRRAVALAERAGSLDRTAARGFYPFYQFVRGLAAYRQDRYVRAIELMRGDASQVLGPAPRLVLAMSLHRSGRGGEARKELAAAVSNHDWREHRVRDQDDWIRHVLRREAEAMILPNLPAFLEGKYQPADNEERFALLGICQFTNRSFTLARLYTDIFAAAPTVGADYRTGYRFNAACAAARSGNGSGIDVTELGDAERAKWRAQAREWIRADLALWSKSLEGAPPAGRDSVRQRLAQWRSEPDLAAIRDAATLAKFPEDERKECVALWDTVGTVLDRCGKSK
jgi:serine/threonine-protein kinase